MSTLTRQEQVNKLLTERRKRRRRRKAYPTCPNCKKKLVGEFTWAGTIEGVTIRCVECDTVFRARDHFDELDIRLIGAPIVR